MRESERGGERERGEKERGSKSKWEKEREREMVSPAAPRVSERWFCWWPLWNHNHHHQWFIHRHVSLWWMDYRDFLFWETFHLNCKVGVSVFNRYFLWILTEFPSFDHLMWCLLIINSIHSSTPCTSFRFHTSGEYLQRIGTVNVKNLNSCYKFQKLVFVEPHLPNQCS